MSIAAKLTKIVVGVVVVICSINTQAQAGYWKTSNLYGVELTRAEGDGESVGKGLAMGFYSSSYPSGPPPKCEKKYSNSIECHAGSASIYCTSDKPGKTPCARQASHYCWRGDDGVHKKEIETENFQCKLVQPGCTAKKAHPVEVYSGRVVESVVDWTDATGHLQLERNYSSLVSSLGAPTNSRFGNNWRSEFDSRASYFDRLIPPFNSSRIHILMADGVEIIFQWQSTKWQPVFDAGTLNSPSVRNWQPLKDVNYSILATAPNVVMQAPDGKKFTYNYDGFLVQTEEIGGYKQFLYYAGAKNVGVTDNLGRKLVFEYFRDEAKKNYVKSATLPDGNKIYFNYAERMLAIPGIAFGPMLHDSYVLSEVIYPDTTPVSFLDNPRMIYDYLNDYRFPNALTRVVNETGSIIGEWAYDTEGRAVSARDYGATVASTFTYDDVNKKVTYANALGKATIYSFASNTAGETILQTVDGIASSNCAADNTSYTFDVNGFRNQATDAEGRITKWVRDSRGLAISTVEGFGTPSAKTITQTWHPLRPLPTQIDIPNRRTNMAYDADGNIMQISVIDTTSATLPQPTRTTTFGYVTFAPPAPPVISATGIALPDVPLTIVNADAETGPVTGTISGWTNAVSTLPVVISTGAPCSTTSRCFVSGVYTAGYSIAYQDIVIPSGNVAEVDNGLRAATVSWLQAAKSSGGASEDLGSVELQFLDGASALVGVNRSIVRVGRNWEARSRTVPIPFGTRTVRLRMIFRNSNKGAYVDGIAVKLIGNGSAAIKPYLTVTNPNALGGVTTGWTQSSGIIGASVAAPCDIVNCLMGNGIGSTTPPPVVPPTPLDAMSQEIALPSAMNPQIDLLARGIDISWFGTATNDATQTSVETSFLDASNAVIANSTLESHWFTSLDSWADNKHYVDVPALARKLRVTFKFTRNQLYPDPAGYVSGITVQLRDRQLPAGTLSLLASVDGPLAGTGDTVTYAYDSKANLASITNEVGHVTQITSYNASGLPLSITDTNGVVTAMAYDLQNRLLSTTVNPGAAQAQTVYTYDAAGNVTKITAPDGSFLQYAYNNALRVTSVTNNTGETITYAYNGNGDMTSSTLKSSAATITKQMTMAYDELGRLMQSIGAASQTTTYSYDRTDLNKQVKDPRNNLYASAYDSLQRLVSTTDQEAKTITLTRNGQDEVTAYVDPRSITTGYVRNGFGEVIQEVSPDAGTTVYTRDARGLVTQETDGRGVVTSSTYDNAGRLLTETYAAAPAENVTYAYDSITGGNKGKGRLTQITDQSGTTAWVYDALGRIITDTRVIAGKTYVTSYVYNAAGRLTQMTYPSGRIVIIARNSLGQVTGVTTKLNAAAAIVNVATALAYKPQSDLLTSISHGNGLVTSAGYDLDYRLTSLNVMDGAALVSGRGFAYADGLNLTGITDAVTPANSNVLSYSPANRLAAASGAWGADSFTYDGVGNRLSDVTASLNRQSTYALTSNRLNSMTQNGAAFRSYTYDGVGNIITDVRPGESFAYVYNKRNRLASVTRNTVAYGTYVYNGLEQLASRTSTAAGAPIGAVHYIYDLDGHLIAEATGSTGATTRDYIWLPSNDNHNDTYTEDVLAANDNAAIDLPLAVAEAANLYHIHTDNLGRPIRMTDAVKTTVWAATWKPWGEIQSISGTTTNNLRFPGQYFQIETGLVHNWHRTYDPVTGRYTQPDPLGFVDGPSIYAYAGNSPFMNVDREGLSHWVKPRPIVPPIGLPRPGTGLPFSPMPLTGSSSSSLPAGCQCTPDEHRKLQDEVNRACRAPGERRCKGNTPADQLQTSAWKNEDCARARDHINGKCFAGGDERHARAAGEAWVAVSKCIRMRDAHNASLGK